MSGSGLSQRWSREGTSQTGAETIESQSLRAQELQAETEIGVGEAGDRFSRRERREQWEREKCGDRESNRTGGREDPTEAPACPPGRLRRSPGSGNSFLNPELLTSVTYLPRASKEDFQRYQKRSHPTSLACASNAPLASNYPRSCPRAHWLGSQHWFLS